ncbi:DUF4221 family protein [Algoriphagus mannitolivorans]|uniref:DUF4221 family protein n=1 Tax=Algoriphagus mannitolivorans TaxID=226504 RepID=UPI0004139B0B|nr:DUF4221 family protein [Algoriphagus mannitolivorans]
MKKLILAFVLISAGIAGCDSGSTTETSSGSFDFSVSMDTVKIDAAEDLLFVGWNLASSGESADGKYLYNFNRNEPISLEIISLEELKLEKIIPMELEGPDGVGSAYMSKVLLTKEGNLILSDGYQISAFDKQFRRVSSFRMDKDEFIVKSLPEGRRIWLDQAFSQDGKKLLAFYGGPNMDDPKEGVISIDFESQTSKIIPIEWLSSWKKHQITQLYEGRPMNAVFSPSNLLVKGDSLIFSVGAENKVHFLNLKTDSISTKTYQSQFTPQRSSLNFPESVDSEEKFRELLKEKQKEVRYRNLLYDSKNKVYWRFTTEESSSKKSVLTVFSEDFEQLGELLLPEGFKVPSKTFVSNGTIYTYLNQDDEVYFVRLKPEFSN